MAREPVWEASDDPHAQLAQWWMLRVLVDLDGWRKLVANPYVEVDLVLSALELADYAPDDREAASARALPPSVRARYDELKFDPPELDGTFRHNLEALGAWLGLTTVEQDLLAFTVIHGSYRPLTESTDGFGPLNVEQAQRLLAGVLDLPLASVREALSPSGRLDRSGLLRLSRSGRNCLQHKLELLSGLGDRLMEVQADVIGMLAPFFHPSVGTGLSRADFGFVRENVTRMLRYLRKARGQTGINLLLYGPPGTGKTELARVFAKDLGICLFEVASAGDKGPLSGEGRLAAYQLAQAVLAGKPDALIVLDEAEDVFTPHAINPFGMPAAGGERHKAWINHTLETNPVPALWISNSVELIDPAYLRRFDLVLELDVPPLATRVKILRRHLGQLPVSNAWMARIAAHPEISPALVGRAAKVATRLGSRDTGVTERHLEGILGGTLKALGLDLPVAEGRAPLLSYRLDVLNPDQPLAPLIEGLRHYSRGAFCLYGPPGTGKTAFAEYTARMLGRPLLVKRASDLLGPYVGMTEGAIARMFQDARAEGAVLLLDEADSFLRDRRQAQQTWQVTQVNELLTQMEHHDGLFICSTNLMEDLDEASLRRFDLKIRFDWLKPAQAWDLFRQVLRDQRVRLTATAPWQERVEQLERLAPGDFATVVRKHRILGQTLSAQRLYAGLVQETRVKAGRAGRAIGFTASL